MKRLLLFSLVLITSNSFAEVKAEAILGVWLTEIKDAKVQIYKKANKYFGKVSWIKEANDANGNPLVDEKNPSKSLQTQPILGIDILIGFVFDNVKAWNGKIYDPKKGETYTCKLWIEDKKLKVRGYLGWLFDTKTWTRVS